MKTKSLAAGIGVAMAVASAQTVSAVVVALTNPGFETDDVPPNNGNPIVPSGWTQFAGGAGGSFVGDGNWVTIPGPHSGDQFYLAYTDSGHRTLRQETSLMWSSLSAGDTLTVSAWTTYRSDLSANVQAYFWFNDSDGAGIYSGFDPSDAAAGVWTERTWTYAVTQTVLDAAVANSWGAVELQVGVIGAPGARQTVFDDISLTYTAVPESSGITLCGAGLGLALLRRKRRV
ncbi:MAG: hypothetical protein V4689_13440 [Verrucomicrobiota bacterium]